MQTVLWAELTKSERKAILTRPIEEDVSQIESRVLAIKEQIRTGGDAALKSLTEKFDGVKLTDIKVAKEAFLRAEKRLGPEFKKALKNAYDNIRAFHKAQKPQPIKVETQPGVTCEVLTRPIEKVGLYIPGGSAPLFSTVLMLAIPAQLAGCKEIYLASPPPIADEIIYAAQLCGVETLYQMGGAQAIFSLGLGTESVTAVDKIFGPGNSYVTEAKKQVSQMAGGAAIDMPAGPSEVLVIADESANPDFVASDLLSQAEHGPDSQVILVTPSKKIAKETLQAIEKLLNRLSRNHITKQSLAKSVAIITHDLTEALAVSNAYAPEHLIIQTDNPRQWLPSVVHAGSVFLGAYSPESMGDYASGTNHVLPTYGHTRAYSSLGLADFYKRMTVQELTFAGFKALAPTVSLLAKKEHLDAHQLAVDIRLEQTH